MLTGAEIRMLVNNLPARERTLVLLAASTGLRQGELFGLKWRDVDFEHGELNVIRSIVCGIEGRCKTESSQKPVPMQPQLAASLIEWRQHCKFKSGDDWIFASRLRGGRKPYREQRSCVITSSPRPKSWVSKSASGGTYSVKPTALAQEPWG